MTKSQLIIALAEREQLRSLEAKAVIDTILDEIGRSLADGERVELRGFGSFSVRQREARDGRNPRTGEIVPVEEKVFIHFRPGKEMALVVDGAQPAPARPRAGRAGGKRSPRQLSLFEDDQ